MTRLKLPIVMVIALLVPNYMFAQALSKVAVVDFERAVVECAVGKKASDQFNAKVDEKQKDLEKRQKEIDDAQTRLRTQDRLLSDEMKTTIQRDVVRKQTELTRLNEDAQKELSDLRDQLLRPVADVATQVLRVLAAERGYTVVVDVSNPQNNVLFASPAVIITDDLVKRIDAELAKQAPAPAPKP